jgi:hypothetical protein
MIPDALVAVQDERVRSGDATITEVEESVFFRVPLEITS